MVLNIVSSSWGAAEGSTCFPEERPSFQVYEPLEKSLQALDSDSSLLLQLLRGYAGGGARLSWLRHFLSADFPAGSCQTETHKEGWCVSMVTANYLPPV